MSGNSRDTWPIDNKSSKNPFHFLRELINDAINSSSFQSKLIKEYYLEISIPYLKTLLKTSLIIQIIYIYSVMFSTTLHKHNRTYSYIGQSVSLIVLLICLGSTMCLKSHVNHSRVSMFAVLTVIVQNMISQFDIMRKMEVAYSPNMQLVIIIFSCIPVQFSTAMCISVLVILYSLMGTALRITFFEDIDIILKNKNESILNVMSDSADPLHRFDIEYYLSGQIILWLSTYLNACFMYTCNRLWRRSAFRTLGDNLHRKKQSKSSMRCKLKWIEAMMPRIVKEEYLLHNMDNKGDKWLYIRPFENVSILFADIVGFTKMSSNKSASQVVVLLNDLFNRFDDLCEITNCEKLGTLGDCYYCVAGCPKPRPDHAISCVEMGLGMCRIIKQFNEDHKENVNMRVGVHTGRVNAAIIGSQRFRFDVYSNDVIIANMMESSGEAGKVHISQSVFDLIRQAYNVETGSDLEIKQEEDHGIAGMIQKSTLIKTYFVNPVSSYLQRKDDKFSGKTRFRVFSMKIDKIDSSLDSETPNDINDLSDDSQGKVNAQKQTFITQLDHDISYIEIIKYDPDQQVQCFNNLPINIVTLKFYDPEIEWHYRTHAIDHIQNLSLYSVKFAPLVECIISLTCTILISVSCVILFYKEMGGVKHGHYIATCFGLTFTLIVIEFWKASTYYSLLQKRFERVLYRLLYHQIYKSIICIYMTSLPNIMCFLLVYNCDSYTNDYYFQARYFSLTLFSLLTGSLFISAPSLVKVAALISNFVSCILFGCIITCTRIEKLVPLRPYYTCIGISNINGEYFNNTQFSEYGIQYLFTLILLIVLIRQREQNLRIWFYVSREAEIEREEALRAMMSAQDLLYNIIPQYVFNSIKANGQNLESKHFSYALSVPKVAVVFASISNFFSKYYREDYKGGENALKLLHTIITKFDNILLRKEFKDVEKIKTINDCYMLASGLNTLSTESNSRKEDHLIALMKFAFEMKKVLTNFNDLYIIGSDKFEIKIGYNIGPVTAGIIGSTKPMYDIWGDTVNVSSRMYSTGKTGEIQTPHYVAEELYSYFEFAYRDKIFVKGKGNMNTYICLREVING